MTTLAPLPRSRPLLARSSDERLVELIRAGNGRAFEVLFDRHHAALLSFCRHLLGSHEEAEDAVQQAFLSAHRQMRKPGRHIHHVKPWLFTIARNRSISILRARREAPADLVDRAALTGLSEQVEERDDVRRLLGDLAEIPFDQRAALLLVETRALSHEEVSRALGCEAKQVKALVFQARSHLIDRRSARETPCAEFQEQIALGGPALRRGPVRHHVKGCPHCGRYRDEVRRQRALIALALPVVPSPGFRESVLASAGAVGGGGGTAGGLGVGAVGQGVGGGGAASAAGGGVAGGGVAGGGAVAGGAGLLAGGAAGGAGASALAGAAGAVKVVFVTATAAAVGLGGGAAAKTAYTRVTDRPEAAQPSQGSSEGAAPTARSEARSKGRRSKRPGARPSAGERGNGGARGTAARRNTPRAKPGGRADREKGPGTRPVRQKGSPAGGPRAQPSRGDASPPRESGAQGPLDGVKAPKAPEVPRVPGRPEKVVPSPDRDAAAKSRGAPRLW